MKEQVAEFESGNLEFYPEGCCDDCGEEYNMFHCEECDAKFIVIEQAKDFEGYFCRRV